MKLIALTIALLSSVGASAQSDEEILSMGHRAWVANFSQGTRVDGEKRYAIALGIRNQASIERSSDRKFLDELSILMSNITKGSARLSDYVLQPTENAELYNARAWVATGIAIDEVINRRSPASKATQADVWAAFRDAQDFHVENHERIDKFKELGGYSVEQHGVEFAAIGYLTRRTMVLIADRPLIEKRHVFSMLVRIIKLTTGSDPLPDV